ncbi:LysR family transcriptional regulator [Streptomyces sp. NBC_01754]|uniref:LysR family transcriptional regulator n=1 Tax=Streptomyces sp. NBC_01754 TaxID=2975930 RepID=UPI002DDC75E5|nr:LysR family transcriptional regulator [Streptomyces sp. NBC_01754]WSC93377.1 LysR family transcriptional regulator [Streptomyces sp. NBC_01754]
MPELSVNALRVVRAVASHGSLSGAARTLGYSQPAVSRQVSAAEKAAGQRLFVRGARGVKTTRAGEIVARFATETLAGLDRLDERLGELTSGPQVRVRVGAFPAANAALLPFALARVLQQQPRLTFALTEASSSQLVHRVVTKRLDVAVVASGPGLPQPALEGLRTTPLPGGELMVGVPRGHSLAAVEGAVPVSELTHASWVVGKGAGDEPQFGAWPTLTDPHIAFRTRTWHSRFGLVAAGLGICVIPGIFAPVVPQNIALVRVDDPNWLGRRILAVTRNDGVETHEIMVRALREPFEDQY